jgi:hypothetical protein
MKQQLAPKTGAKKSPGAIRGFFTISQSLSLGPGQNHAMANMMMEMRRKVMTSGSMYSVMGRLSLVF